MLETKGDKKFQTDQTKLNEFKIEQMTSNQINDWKATRQHSIKQKCHSGSNSKSQTTAQKPQNSVIIKEIKQKLHQTKKSKLYTQVLTYKSSNYRRRNI